jgi:hypothetical protein
MPIIASPATPDEHGENLVIIKHLIHHSGAGSDNSDDRRPITVPTVPGVFE